MADNPYANVATEQVDVASEAEVEQRLAFIRRTYLHLTGAVAAFIGMLTVFFQTGLARPMTGLMFGGQFSWLSPGADLFVRDGRSGLRIHRV